MSLLAAAAIAAAKFAQKASQRKSNVEALKARRKEQLKGLNQASQMSAEEQQVMARMRKGAEQGTMDVAKLNMQMAQPLYQQGEAQEAQAMQRITQQGLEGSIIAQDVSRRVGSDVRASIAEQARKIAMENERTKADAARRLSQAQMKRGQLLREIAMKRGQVEAEYKAGRAAQGSDLSMLLDTGLEMFGQQGTAAANEYVFGGDLSSFSNDQVKVG